MYKLLAKIWPNINWKKVEYRFSMFDYVKCADCDFDGKADAYCKPPLGACCFTEKEDVQINPKLVR